MRPPPPPNQILRRPLPSRKTKPKTAIQQPLRPHFPAPQNPLRRQPSRNPYPKMIPAPSLPQNLHEPVIRQRTRRSQMHRALHPLPRRQKLNRPQKIKIVYPVHPLLAAPNLAAQSPPNQPQIPRKIPKLRAHHRRHSQQDLPRLRSPRRTNALLPRRIRLAETGVHPNPRSAPALPNRLRHKPRRPHPRFRRPRRRQVNHRVRILKRSCPRPNRLRIPMNGLARPRLRKSRDGRNLMPLPVKMPRQKRAQNPRPARNHNAHKNKKASGPKP